MLKRNPALPLVPRPELFVNSCHKSAYRIRRGAAESLERRGRGWMNTFVDQVRQ